MGACFWLWGNKVWGQGAAIPTQSLAAALSPAKWSDVQNSVDRALAWLVTQQAADGSFPTLDAGQPGVTSLCVMAFLSRGHQPGFGPYGQPLNRAIDFVVACQKNDGLISLVDPGPVFEGRTPSHTASYDHAISGLMLGEVYGHISGTRAHKVRAAITRAIRYSHLLQVRPKVWASDLGGVRYVRLKNPRAEDADLSVTAWHLMFWRSARNAEFNVPQSYMNDGISFVRRCWNPEVKMFNYIAHQNNGATASRGLAGAGIVSLSMAGQHNSAIALAAGVWLRAHPIHDFSEAIGPMDEFYYSAYYCSQAAAQLGGQYWADIYPPMVEALAKIQRADGSFPPEPRMADGRFGPCYSTAMAVLAMTPAYQLLPVYQR
jgi:hypothetical protein